MILTAPSARGQSSWDGQFWTTKSRDLKLVYVGGFIDAARYGEGMASSGALLKS